MINALNTNLKVGDSILEAGPHTNSPMVLLPAKLS